MFRASLPVLVLVSMVACARPRLSEQSSSEPGGQQRSDVEINGVFEPVHRPELPPNPKPWQGGKPLFSCGYFNGAWFSDYGHVLDAEGRIWFYEQTRHWPARPAAGGRFLEGGLRDHFGGAVLQLRRVAPAQLADMQRRAQAAAGGELETQNGSVDGGTTGCTAYLWEKPDAYREVMLGSQGDVNVTNSSPAAAELMHWLRQELGMGRHPRHSPDP